LEERLEYAKSKNMKLEKALREMTEDLEAKTNQPTDNQIYGFPANQFSPSASTTLPPFPRTQN